MYSKSPKLLIGRLKLFVLSLAFIFFSSNLFGQSPACNGLINVPLGNDCTTTITAAQMVAGNISTIGYTVELFEDEAMTIPIATSPMATSSEAGNTITVNVLDQNGDFYCWGFAFIEDKTDPVLTCPCADYSPVDETAFTLLGTFGGNTYYVSTTSSTWPVANAAAAAATGHLATVSSAAENAFIFSAISAAGNDVWLGLTDDAAFGGTEANSNPTTGWIWSNGENFTYNNWDLNQPNNINGNQDYVEMFAGSGTWNDEFNTTSNPFILEIEGICELPCDTDLTTLTAATAMDACGMVTLDDDEVIEEFDCNTNDYFKVVTRTYTATDAAGNTATCTQKYYIEFGTLAGVTAPRNYDNIDLAMLDCEDKEATGGWNAIDAGDFVDNNGNDLYVGHPSPDDALNADGSVLYTGTGRPTGEATCTTIRSTFVDIPLYTCSNGSSSGCFDILRRWTVLDWCTSATAEYNQIIKVGDNQGPQFAGIADLTISTDVWTCDALWYATVPTITDNCSLFGDYSVSASAGTVSFNTTLQQWVIEGLPLGDHTITYTVSDCCNNETVETIQLTVEDLIPPTAVCNAEVTSVSVVTDGTGKAFATTFDDGSHDNCSETVYFKVIRTDDLIGTTNGSTVNQGATTCDTSNGDDDSARTGNQIYYDDFAMFCCEDIGNTSLYVTVRVFDVDPGTGPVDPSRMEAGGDLFGHHNECDARVTVMDNIAPTITCPSNVTISCEFGILGLPDLTQFGTVVTDVANVTTNTIVDPSPFHADQMVTDGLANDNCSVTVTGPVESFSLVCGQGLVTRAFTGTDDAGRTASCIQRIEVVNFDPFVEADIDWPNTDIEVSCANGTHPDDLPAADGKPRFTDRGVCELLDTNFVDEISTFTQANALHCKKIRRTWILIDWCQYDATDSDANNVFDATDDGIIPGQWSSPIQEIKVLKPATATSIDCPADITNASTIAVTSVVATLNTSCSAEVSYVVDFDDATGLADVSGTGLDASRIFPAGTHTVTFNVTDGCCTTTSCTMTVMTDPCLDVISGLDVFLDEFSCTATITPSMLYNSATPPALSFQGDAIRNFSVTDITGATGTSTMIEVIVTVNGVDCPTTINLIDDDAPVPQCGAPIGGIELSEGETHTFNQGDLNLGSMDACFGNNILYSYSPATVSCSDFPGTYTTRTVPVTITLTDQVGNFSSCTVDVRFIPDAANPCTTLPTNASIAGIVKNEEGLYVEDVEIRISDDMAMMTEQDGSYLLDELAPFEDYLVRPYSNADADNGISTFDLVLMSKHILNIERLATPYKMIAADVNNSGEITTLDMVQLRKILLFIDNEFQFNNSWRFIDANYVFDNPSNPFTEAFPEYHLIQNLDQQMQDIDFVAVKIGDLNCDAETINGGVAQSRSFDGILDLFTTDQKLAKSDSYTVDFTMNDLEDLTGYQFTLAFDENALQFESIQCNNELGIHENHFGLSQLEDGFITTSFVNNDNKKIEQDDVLFSISFKALSDGQLSDYLSINSQLTKAEAYTRGVNEENAPVDYLNVTLNFDKNSSLTANTMRLFQNRPNPFKNETLISFELPEAGSAQMSIYDISGRVVKVIKGTYEQGYNEIHLNSSELSAKGVLYYQLETSSDTAVKKMTILD